MSTSQGGREVSMITGLMGTQKSRVLIDFLFDQSLFDLYM